MSSSNQLSHITLICKDIHRTGEFLKKIFGAVEYYATKETVYSVAKEKFFKIGGLWIVTMAGEPVARTYNHLAFQAEAAEFPKLCQAIKKLGLSILPGRKRTAEEGESIYFYDYDNHLFELHSGDLEKRLVYYITSDAVSKTYF